MELGSLFVCMRNSWCGHGVYLAALFVSGSVVLDHPSSVLTTQRAAGLHAEDEGGRGSSSVVHSGSTMLATREEQSCCLSQCGAREVNTMRAFCNR
jgi:hypothetical protein